MGDTPATQTDNGPPRLDTPPYPNASRIENGQAFDIEGKVLGAVDDEGKAADSAQKPSIDYDALAKQAGSVGSAPVQTAPIDYDALAKQAGSVGSEPAKGAVDYDALAKQAGSIGSEPIESAPRPGLNAGAARGTRFESFANLGNYFIAKPLEGEENTGVLHSFHQALSFPNAIYHAFTDPGTEQEKRELLQKINEENAKNGTEDIKNANHVPKSLATNPSSVTLALHRLMDAPANELNEKADKELETSRELWDQRKNWVVHVPIFGTNMSIPLGEAIALSQSMSGGADKVLSKIPMMGPVAHGISKKFEDGDISGGITDIALLQAAEYAHGKITGEPVTTPSRVFTDKGAEWAKGTRAAIDSVKERFAADISEKANKAREDFMKSAPPSKAAPYDLNDYEIVRRSAEEGHKADKLQGGEGITGIESARDMVEDGRQKIEEKRSNAVKEHANKPITTNVAQDVAEALAEADKVTPGFRDEGMKILEDHNFKDPTVKEADGIRKKLVADNRAIQKKNMWDVMTARQTDPTFAAREAAVNSLREGIYGALDAAGVPEAYDWARDEAAHIRVRDALERQLYNAEKIVRGTAQGGVIRKGLAKGATLAGATGGAALGGATLGPVGAAVGGAVGAGVGSIVGERLAPPNMTHDALMGRSFESTTATPEGPSIPASQAGAAPAGPEIPPPPQTIPVVMPPPDHSLHSELATRVRSTVKKTDFDDLMARFQAYLDKTPPKNLTKEDIDLLQKLNDSQSNHKTAIEQAVQKAVDQNKAAREKWQKEVQKIQEKHASEQEAKKAEDISAIEKGESPTDENPHLASLGRGDESGLVSHSIARKAHAPAQEISGLGPGLTSQDAHIHEAAHLVIDAVDGEPTGVEIRSDKHPDVPKGSRAATVFNASELKNPNGDINIEKLEPVLNKWTTQKMAGPASHEVFTGMTKEESLAHSATTGDVRQARAIVRLVHPDWSEGKVNEYLDGAYERARNFLTQPHIADRIKANAAVREEGLPDTLHWSRERVSQFQKDIREAHNEQGTDDSGPDRGTSGEVGKESVRPASEGKEEKNAGGSEGGRGRVVQEGDGASEAASRLKESQLTKTPYTGAERRSVTRPSDELSNLIFNLIAKAAAGDALAAEQLADIRAHPFESARSELGGADINSMKPRRTVSREEAEANTIKRAEGRNRRFSDIKKVEKEDYDKHAREHQGEQ